MRNDIRALMRRLFSAHAPSRSLELVFADRQLDARGRQPRTAVQRETLHPLKGWTPECREGGPGETNRFRMGREPKRPWPTGK